jgi:hypothetical protein
VLQGKAAMALVNHRISQPWHSSGCDARKPHVRVKHCQQLDSLFWEEKPVRNQQLNDVQLPPFTTARLA